MDQTYDKHLNSSIPLSDIPKTPTRNRSTARTPRKGRHEDVAWTVLRCNRLLRTIASRIHILRRLSENDFAEQALRTPKVKRKRDISVDPVEKLESKLAALGTPSRGDDPEWFPPTEKKGAARTYGGRGKLKKSETAVRPEGTKTEVGFRTPFIRKVLRPEAAVSPADDAYSTSSRLAQMGRKGRQDSIQPKTHAERALRTLLDSFDSLLASTDPRVAEPRRGASSLLGMCLRKVPAYIEYEQNYAEEVEDDYGFDAIESVYLDLERLGKGSWPGLRQVTRAHAVKMIIDAMAERMWPLKSLDALMDICMKHQAVVEGHQLLRAWLVSSKGKMESPIEKFVELAVKADSRGFMFRILDELLASNTLECAELSPVADLWQELPTAMARASSQRYAAAFLERYISNCCQLEGEASRNTELGVIHSTMPLLTSMGLMATRRVGLQGGQADSMTGELYRLALSVATNSGHAGNIEKSASALEIEDLVLMSSISIWAARGVLEARDGTVDFGPLADLLLERDAQARSMSATRHVRYNSDRAALVGKALRCIESLDKSAAQDVTKRICTGLLRAANTVADDTTSILADLAVNISTAWAEHCGNNDSYAFADEIQREALVCLSDRARNATSSSSSGEIGGFRWEEGISEWVASTPVERGAAQRKSREGSILSQDSGIGMSEPVSPIPKPAEVDSAPCDDIPPLSESDVQSPSSQRLLPHHGNFFDVQHSGTKDGLSRATFEPEIENHEPDAEAENSSTPPQHEQDKLDLDMATPCLLEPQMHIPLSEVLNTFDEYDELSMTPCRPKAAPLAMENLPLREKALASSEPAVIKPSLVLDSPEPVPAEERDELSITPYAVRQPQTPLPRKKAATKARRQPRKAIEATPARMTLRSRRKITPAEDASRSADVSDDELGA